MITRRVLAGGQLVVEADQGTEDDRPEGLDGAGDGRASRSPAMSYVEREADGQGWRCWGCGQYMITEARPHVAGDCVLMLQSRVSKLVERVQRLEHPADPAFDKVIRDEF